MEKVNTSQSDVEWVEIESIEDRGEVDVFDMEIEDNHNFFANGINVSNCLGGPLAYQMFNDEVISQFTFDQITPDIVKGRLPEILLAMENDLDKLVDAFGEENFFLELQFNKLPSQHALNMCLIELHKKTGISLVTTCDSHYIKGLYKNREMYKQMAWMSRKGYEIKELPESEEDLDCDLYYKNPEQLWECYKDTTKDFDFYEDGLVCESMERAYDVAHDLIGNPMPDRTVKLPSFTFPEGEKPINSLVRAAREGLVSKGLANNPVYVDRLKKELATVKELNFAEYFLTTKSLIDLAKDNMLVGRGRGSGAGSLLCYCLGITGIDPIKYSLLFERFLNKNRSDYPDIDCLCAGTLIQTSNNGTLPIEDLKIGMVIPDRNNEDQVILDKRVRKAGEKEVLYQIDIETNESYGSVICSGNHRLFANNGEVMFARDIEVGQLLEGSKGAMVKNTRAFNNPNLILVDIQVTGDHSFKLVPFSEADEIGGFYSE